MNTTEKGQIGLAKTIADLVSKGYNVFLPFADVNVVDLVCMNSNGDLKRIQIKYKKKTGGCISIPLQGVQNGQRVNINLKMVDMFAVYCPDNDEVYYVPTEVLINSGKQTSHSIRIDEAKQKQPNECINAEIYKKLKF